MQQPANGSPGIVCSIEEHIKLPPIARQGAELVQKTVFMHKSGLYFTTLFGILCVSFITATPREAS